MNLKQLKNAVPLILVSAALVTMSFAFIRNSAGTKQSDLSHYSGKELFRGIFFSQGEVGQRIPSRQTSIAKWNKYSAQTQEAYLAFYDDIINNIDKNDPGYFDAFKKKVITRNYSDVAESVLDGSKAIFEAGVRSPKYNPFFSTVEEMAKSGEMAKFNLATEDGKIAFAKYLNEKIKGRLQPGDAALQQKTADVQASLAVPIFILAAAIWDAVAAVNYATTVTIETVAVVHSAVYAKTRFWREAPVSDDVSKLQSERLVAEIANI